MKTVFTILIAMMTLCVHAQTGNTYVAYPEDEFGCTVSYMYSNPPVPVQTFLDTTYSFDGFENVYYDCLSDMHISPTTSAYVVVADEDGKIQKIHVDSLLFSSPMESQMAPQQFNTQVAANYVIEKVEYFDMNGVPISPASASEYVVKVTFATGDTITQKYIERK